MASKDFDAIDEAIAKLGDPNLGISQTDPYMGSDDDHLRDVQEVQIPLNPPQTLLWRVLIVPVKPRYMSKGGIALPDSVMEAEDHLNYLGRIAYIGPLSGQHNRYKVVTNRLLYWLTAGHFGWRSCWNHKVGDLVIFGRYAGQKIWYRGVKLIIVNDDELLAAPESVKGFKIYA